MLPLDSSLECHPPTSTQPHVCNTIGPHKPSFHPRHAARPPNRDSTPNSHGRSWSRRRPKPTHHRAPTLKGCGDPARLQGRWPPGFLPAPCPSSAKKGLRGLGGWCRRREGAVCVGHSRGGGRPLRKRGGVRGGEGKKLNLLPGSPRGSAHSPLGFLQPSHSAASDARFRGRCVGGWEKLPPATGKSTSGMLESQCAIRFRLQLHPTEWHLV